MLLIGRIMMYAGIAIGLFGLVLCGNVPEPVDWLTGVAIVGGTGLSAFGADVVLGARSAEQKKGPAL
jgi:hypothetical protein